MPAHEVSPLWPPGHEQPGVVLDGQVYSVAAVTLAYDEDFFVGGGLAQLAQHLAQPARQLALVPPGTRLGSPVAQPSRIVGVGLN